MGYPGNQRFVSNMMSIIRSQRVSRALITRLMSECLAFTFIGEDVAGCLGTPVASGRRSRDPLAVAASLRSGSPAGSRGLRIYELEMC